MLSNIVRPRIKSAEKTGQLGNPSSEQLFAVFSLPLLLSDQCASYLDKGLTNNRRAVIGSIGAIRKEMEWKQKPNDTKLYLRSNHIP